VGGGVVGESGTSASGRLCHCHRGEGIGPRTTVLEVYWGGGGWTIRSKKMGRSVPRVGPHLLEPLWRGPSALYTTHCRATRGPPGVHAAPVTRPRLWPLVWQRGVGRAGGVSGGLTQFGSETEPLDDRPNSPSSQCLRLRSIITRGMVQLTYIRQTPKESRGMDASSGACCVRGYGTGVRGRVHSCRSDVPSRRFELRWLRSRVTRSVWSCVPCRVVLRVVVCGSVWECRVSRAL